MKEECRNYETMFDAMLDNELSERKQKSFLEHVETCSSCGEKWQIYQSIATGFSQLPKQSCPPAVVDRIMNNLHEHNESAYEVRALFHRFFNFMSLRVAYGAMAIVLLIGLYFLPQIFTQKLAPEHRYTASEIKHAEVQVKQALAAFNIYSRKTERLIEEDILVNGVLKPMKRSVNQALKPISTRSSS